jgi:D-alanyl-D-alanine endopeptidase (penicillin-binding protein 7)
MRSIASTRRIVMGLGLSLLLEAPAALLAAPAPAATQGGSASVQLASATAASKQTTKKPRRRTRRRAPALRLPEVTQYGIPRLHVKAAYVVDEQSGRVLFQKNHERVMPIASLTKLVTAMVLLDTDPDWDRTIEILPEDVRNSSRSRIRAREEMTVRDLIHASLMSSDNVATKALARTCGLTYDDFIQRMNEKADSLGLTGTHFVEPTGLSERNVATAEACARLLRTASANPIVSAIMQKQSYAFRSNRKPHNLVNTNRLLSSKWRVTAGKTGYINEAGYCLVTSVAAPSGADITAVVLGAPSNALRFAEARRILDWTFRFGLNQEDAVSGPGND